MADLDHFKLVNDKHGHLGGDAVLREAGRRMQTAMRPYDMVGRYGGEFLIVLPGCDRESAIKFAERLRERVGIEPVRHGEREVAVTVSQGVAVYPGIGDVDIHVLLQARKLGSIPGEVQRSRQGSGQGL